MEASVETLPISIPAASPAVSEFPEKRLFLREHHFPSACFRNMVDRENYDGLSPIEEIKCRIVDWLAEWNISLYPANQSAIRECDDLQKINCGIFEACYFVPDYHPRRTTELLGGLLAVRLVDNVAERGRMWDSMERFMSTRQPGEDADKVALYEVSFLETKEEDDNFYEGMPEASKIMTQEDFLKKYDRAIDLLAGEPDPYTHTRASTSRRVVKPKKKAATVASVTGHTTVPL